MPPKRRLTKKVMLYDQHGNGFFGDLWDGVKKGVGAIVPFVKDNKLISRGLSMFPNPAAQTGAKVAGMFGLGKKRSGQKGKGKRVARKNVLKF